MANEEYNRQTRYTRKPTPKSPELGQDAPGVSILRPLKGIDLDLAENLRSSFEQRYPKFEIIFSVARADDPAVSVVKQLMKEYPEADCRLIVGTDQVEGGGYGSQSNHSDTHL